MVGAARAHRRKFAEMRKGHYGNEAEALKRMQASMDEEESSGNENDSRAVPPPLPIDSASHTKLHNGS